MRRERTSILTDVLAGLAQYSDQRVNKVHVTVLAARVNLPHDRLKAYLQELVRIGLVAQGDELAVTVKGRQFLDCYHAWLHVLQLYGVTTDAAVIPPEATPSRGPRGAPFGLEGPPPAPGPLAVPTP